MHFFRKSRRLRRWLCLDHSGVVPGATGERPSLEMCKGGRNDDDDDDDDDDGA